MLMLLRCLRPFKMSSILLEHKLLVKEHRIAWKFSCTALQFQSLSAIEIKEYSSRESAQLEGICKLS